MWQAAMSALKPVFILPVATITIMQINSQALMPCPASNSRDTDQPRINFTRMAELPLLALMPVV